MDYTEPITKVILLKCPLELDNNNQLTFNNIDSQQNYFNSLPKIEYENFTYQRHDGYIRIPANQDTIMNYNYVAYQNANYNDKWFYAFITRIEWQNPNMTDVYIKTDVFQTWQFELEYKPSFIEREHVNDDTIGLHTVPESVETGDYMVQGVYKDTMGSADYIVVMASTVDPTLTAGGEYTGGPNGGGIYGGVSAGYRLYTFDPTQPTLSKVIKAFDEAGVSSAIVGLFMCPRKMIVPNLTIEIDNYEVPNSYTTNTLAFEVPKPSSLLNYQPKNNKLLTYPYRYLEVTNNNGMSGIYNYEYFSQPFADFIIDFVPTIGCSIMLSPNSYKDYATKPIYPEGLTGAKFPVAGWQNDVFTNWLTQNGVNIALNMGFNTLSTFTGGASTALGMVSNNPWATLGGLQQVSSSIENIASTVGSIYEHSLIPPQANGQTNIGDVTFSRGNCCFTAYQMSIKPEFAKIIDNYLSMFGYKVNIVKIPNITGRQNWNYVKTIGLNLVANIPQTAIEELKTIFDKGITLWHNPTTFLDYSQSNNII